MYQKKYSSNPNLSTHKELILAITLTSGELPADVRRTLNRIFSENQIKNDIRDLNDAGFIQKLNKDGMRGICLTEQGAEYFATKYPDKYDHTLFISSDTHKYEPSTRKRRRQCARVLLMLYLNGVEISDRSADASRLLHGISVAINKPFFVPSRTLNRCHPRLLTAYGSRYFGAVFSADAITLVYAPNVSFNLYTTSEERLKSSFSAIVSSSAAQQYNHPNSLRYLYCFQNDDDVVDSFCSVGKSNNRTPNTVRWFKTNYIKDSFIICNSSPCSLSCDFLEKVNREKIDQTFRECYGIRPINIQNIRNMYIDGLYHETDIPCYMVWNLSPSAIVMAMEYIRSEIFPRNGMVYFLCFDEQEKLIMRIFGETCRSASQQIAICSLSYAEVKAYINY